MKGKKLLLAVTSIVMAGTMIFAGACSKDKGPKGDTGDRGAAGVGIKTVEYNEADDSLTVTYTDGTTSTVTMPGIKVARSGGYDEGAYVEFGTPASINSTIVSYKENGSNFYTPIDNELIREQSGGTLRADLLGLEKGTYTIKIESGAYTKVVEDVAVTAYDRSGYADFGIKSLADKSALQGDYLGAYNADGTLKEDAEVIYVSEATKNTVSVTWDKKYTGIANILGNLKSAGHPVAIRVIGQIAAATWTPLDYSKFPSGSATENLLEEDGSLAIQNVKGRNGKSLEEYVKTKYAFAQSKKVTGITQAKGDALLGIGVKLYTEANRDAGKTAAGNGEELTVEHETTFDESTNYYTNWDFTKKSQNVQKDELVDNGFNTYDTSKYSIIEGSGDNMQNKVKYTASDSLSWDGDTPKVKAAAKFDCAYNLSWIKGSGELINTTLEGVGADAQLFQWGVSWKGVSSVEVRNLTFDDYTEDACAFEGSSTSWTDPLDDNATKYFWVHHNTFNEGKNYWDVTDEQDKHEGDGATDLKGNSFVTFSYNHYYKNHKTGLVGGGNSHADANITFHHNFYDQCSSRLPLARMANMHMYNNYYYKSSSYSISLRSTAYAFVENCYFEDNTVAFTFDGADWFAKVFGCEFVNSPLHEGYDANDATTKNANLILAETREQEVVSKNTYSPSFDISDTAFYYNATDKKTDVSVLTTAAQAKTDCMAKAGVHK